MKLVLAKFTDIVVGENFSRGPGFTYSEREIKELADQILENDRWDPPDVAIRSDGKYDLTSGFHRYYSALYLDQQGQLPKCVGEKHQLQVLAYNRDSQRALFDNAVENICRTDLNTYQLAHTLFGLQQRTQASVEDLCRAFNLHGQSVRNYIRLARNLDETIQEAWRNNEGTKRAIPLLQLLRWASLTPEIQKEAYLSSDWAKSESPGRNRRRTHHIRTIHEIEERLLVETDTQVVNALRWVLRKPEIKDGNRYAWGVDRTDAGRSQSNGAGNRRAASVQRTRSVREDEGRGSNGATSHDAGVTGRGAGDNPPSAKSDDVGFVAENIAPIGRKARNPRGG